MKYKTIPIINFIIVFTYYLFFSFYKSIDPFYSAFIKILSVLLLSAVYLLIAIIIPTLIILLISHIFHKDILIKKTFDFVSIVSSFSGIMFVLSNIIYNFSSLNNQHFSIILYIILSLSNFLIINKKIKDFYHLDNNDKDRTFKLIIAACFLLVNTSFFF